VHSGSDQQLLLGDRLGRAAVIVAAATVPRANDMPAGIEDVTTEGHRAILFLSPSAPRRVSSAGPSRGFGSQGGWHKR